DGPVAPPARSVPAAGPPPPARPLSSRSLLRKGRDAMKSTRWFTPLAWFGAPRRKAPASRRPGFHPSLESLEERQVPTVVHWTGAAGDSQWLTAGNWDGGQLPTASDDVIIDVVDNPTIVYAGGDATVNSLESADNVQLTS